MAPVQLLVLCGRRFALVLWCAAFGSLMLGGCQLYSPTRMPHPWAADSVPAHRLPPEAFAASRDALRPVPASRLSQPRPIEHRIDAGDLLSIFIYGVYPPNQDETPLIRPQQGVNQRYYPPGGNVVAPSTGLPMKVNRDGELDLPLIGPLLVRGMTTGDVVQTLRSAYYEQNILLEGQGRIAVELMVPRTHRVVVLREDVAATAANYAPASNVEQSRRGSGNVVDLPIYENDVLHALAATGGLPGSDAANEVFVIRGQAAAGAGVLGDQSVEKIIETLSPETMTDAESIIRIPLAVPTEGCLPFGPTDVLLSDGDIVYIPKRREYFYTGGMLPGGRVPLPRDEDLDIIEAISMVGASPGGVMGADGGALLAARQTCLRPATRAIVLRTLCDGRQMNIRVDLDRAMHDPRERLVLQPGDVLMLHQKPEAAVLNTLAGLGLR